jgi:hypothetical protein
MSILTRAGHRRRRFLPLVWTASAVSAVVLILGVNGTLSSWTSAILTNSNNTAATAGAVVLKEVNGANTCISSQGGGVSNSYTCATINKYGGTATPLTPGTQQQVDVTFSNVGTQAASSFKLEPQTCSQTPAAAATAPAVNNLCTAGATELGVAASCSDGATYASANAWTDLTYASGAPGAMPAALTHTASLAVNASWTCRFTVALGSNASPSSSGITVSQALKWTLAA